MALGATLILPKGEPQPAPAYRAALDDAMMHVAIWALWRYDIQVRGLGTGVWPSPYALHVLGSSNEHLRFARAGDAIISAYVGTRLYPPGEAFFGSPYTAESSAVAYVDGAVLEALARVPFDLRRCGPVLVGGNDTGYRASLDEDRDRALGVFAHEVVHMLAGIAAHTDTPGDDLSYEYWLYPAVTLPQNYIDALRASPLR